MINVDYKGKKYKVRNTMEEITIDEFQFISHTLMRTDLAADDKWFEIFYAIGVDRMVIENICLFDFTDLIGGFDFTNKYEIQKEILIDGVPYYAYEGERMRIPMKQLKHYQKIIGKAFNYCHLMSIIYKNEEMDSRMENPLEYKEEFFRNQPASILVPILQVINKALYKKLVLNANG